MRSRTHVRWGGRHGVQGPGNGDRSLAALLVSEDKVDPLVQVSRDVLTLEGGTMFCDEIGRVTRPRWQLPKKGTHEQTLARRRTTSSGATNPEPSAPRVLKSPPLPSIPSIPSIG